MNDFTASLLRGPVDTYYPSGQKHISRYYDENGLLDRDDMRFFEDGRLSELTQYDHGVKNGEHTAYYSNGNIWHQTFYDQGLKQGRAIEYYENGQVKIEEFFDKDALNGVTTVFNADGSVRKQAVHEHGVMIKEDNPRFAAAIDAFRQNNDMAPPVATPALKVTGNTLRNGG